MSAAGPVRAAGGVVVRAGRVAVVHRPRYRDWTLPKGKLGPGEDWAEAALREVEEETGFACELVRELGSVEYRDPNGLPKQVRFWEMRVASGGFRPNCEVDELRWATPAEALELLSHERDRELIGRLAWHHALTADRRPTNRRA